jgi:hypothetical protein
LALSSGVRKLADFAVSAVAVASVRELEDHSTCNTNGLCVMLCTCCAWTSKTGVHTHAHSNSSRYVCGGQARGRGSTFVLTDQLNGMSLRFSASIIATFSFQKIETSSVETDTGIRCNCRHKLKHARRRHGETTRGQVVERGVRSIPATSHRHPPRVSSLWHSLLSFCLTRYRHFRSVCVGECVCLFCHLSTIWFVARPVHPLHASTASTTPQRNGLLDATC